MLVSILKGKLDIHFVLHIQYPTKLKIELQFIIRYSILEK